MVSEETGVVSLAINGRLTRNYDREKLRVILLKMMQHNDKKNVKKNVRSAGERVKAWIIRKKID